MRKFFTFLVVIFLSAGAGANVMYIKDEKTSNAKISETGIYFNGDISNQTVTWLLSSLAEISGSYPNIKSVDLYLNSNGGDMDAGYVAYEALRKSPLKINMINTAMTASAATMIYCASVERYAKPMSVFLLHPAAASNERDDYIKPDQARRVMEESETYNKLFRSIYASCLNISKEEIEKITTSESNRVIYNFDDAVRNGLVLKGDKEGKSYLLTYFITDAPG